MFSPRYGKATASGLIHFKEMQKDSTPAMELIKHPARAWANIEEIDPDEWDLKMLKDIETDPDCHEFIPQEELLKELGISL